VEPLASIVIPCYKGEQYLAQAIDSCRAQSYPNLEIIVVDDASPDRCAAIAESYARLDPRMRVICLPDNLGVSAAFNAGFDASSGEYMTRLAQDDIFTVEAVAVMVKYLTDHPDLGLVYCDEQRVDEEGLLVGRRKSQEPDEVLSNGNKIGLCVMWRRKVWQTVGRFNSEFDTAEDYDYWLRVKDCFPIGRCPDGPQVSMRIHPGMGSKVYSGRQEVIAAKVQARHSKAGVAGVRRILQKGYFNAAYNYKMQARLGAALQHILLAITCWPFDLKLYRLLVAIVLDKLVRGWQNNKTLV
jgi:glycosyltransferase involved in cell wall biosynthesis